MDNGFRSALLSTAFLLFVLLQSVRLFLQTRNPIVVVVIVILSIVLVLFIVALLNERVRKMIF